MLVIGGGGAGLRAAVEAREKGADVILASKSRVGYANNTYLAKSSIASTGWGDDGDNLDVHLEDTVAGGRFINDRKLVSLMTKGAKAQIVFLQKCGVRFSKDGDHLNVGYVAGHSYPRHIRGKKRVGSELLAPLKAYAAATGVRFADRIFVSRLFESENRIAGAFGLSADGSFSIIQAKSVVLATGGYAQAYLQTNNAAGITGDGQALAFERGVSLKDMEFVQFYPTALGKLGNRVLLYETFVSDSGAILRNVHEEDIVVKHGLDDPMRLTRDRLARAVITEIMEGRDVDGGVIMDISPIAEDRIDQLRYLLPLGRSADTKTFVVSPTAHFCMGGICVDTNTETSLSGLFAAGEVCAGIHGANRLGGNALCEVFTMGCLSGGKAARRAEEIGHAEIAEKDAADEKKRLTSLFKAGGHDPGHLCRSLKEILWRHGGIIRDKKGLETALDRIEEIRSLAQNVSIDKPGTLIRFLELKNMLLLAEMICRAALLRAESRGSHYRSDFPEEDNTGWLKNIVIRKTDAGLRIDTVAVPGGT